MRYLLIFGALITFSYCNGQEFKVGKTEDDELVYLINRIKYLTEKQTDDLSIKVYTVDNLPGSAGYDSGEITHDILIAVSEYDEFPEQSLFRISSFYNPTLKDWKTAKNGEPQLIVEYGPYNKRKNLVLRISLQKIEID